METLPTLNNAGQYGKPEIIKEEEFRKYVLWKSLPYPFKHPPKSINGNRPTPLEFAVSMGLDDDEILELIQIPTQQAFAERFGVSEEVTTDWNKKIAKRDMLGDIREWALKLSKNVLTAMYNNALSTKNLNADKDRVNFLKYCGWSEKSEIKLGMSDNLLDILKESLKQRQIENGTRQND
jgi:hypothetical protein